MRIKHLAPLIIIVFILAFAYHFIALAAVDAPHNEESNEVGCGSCHAEGILESVFWGGSGTYDSICLWKCHTEPFCPYTPLYGLFVETHTDSDETALAECRTCHDPHYQKQKNYKNTDWNNLYLAYGEITSYKYYDPDDYEVTYFDPDLRDTSVLAYSSITYKTETGWDATRLIGKTEECRHTILFPNERKLGYSYVIIAIEEVTPTTGTIQVKGDVTPVYQYISTSDFAVIYGQFIRDNINGNPVKFFDPIGVNSFGDGELPFDGVCEVCHTQTTYHRNNISGDHTHYASESCRGCHAHIDGFGHGGGAGGGECIECHGHDFGYEYEPGKFSQGKGTYVSHSTHTEDDDEDEVKGPLMVCSDCHDINNYPYFNSGTDGPPDFDGNIDLSETDVCNPCHSPNGAFDGVDTDIPTASIGAKDNWDDGVYQVDGTLTVGKEKWCAGCHDNVPAIVNSNTAPDICGDNSTYGYYLGAHGNMGYGANRNGVSYSQGECVHCHDVSVAGTEPPLRIINESFETSPGYDETWVLTIDGGSLDPDSVIPGIPPPSAGSQCLQSISAGPEYQAYATLDYGEEKDITFTMMYLYVEDDGLANGDNKNIGALKNSTNNNVFIFRLNKNGTQLRFNLILYNDGSFKYYFSDISLNTWYRIEVKYNNINDSWAWRLDGTTKDKGRLKGDHRNGIQKWNFGFMTSSQDETGTVYYDLIAVNTDDWVGEEQSATGIPLHGGQLFADNNPDSQTENFCFQCHKGDGSVQNGGITNYTYSKNFGGGSQTFDTIYDAFNPSTGDTPSSHNLSDVLNHAESRDIGFTSNTNACVICHDPHYAQRNYPVTLSGKGGVKTAIRRPSDYTPNPVNLWGDEDASTSGRDERMRDYTDDYQSPYFVGVANNYEPANDTTSDGSNIPNFEDFCNNCHGDNDVYSTERGENLKQINWASDDLHGIRHKDTEGLGYTTDPYGGGETDNYVLSCTDCHEPHGSQNEWLLRTTANGIDNISVPNTDTGKWLDFCTACHVLTNHEPPYQDHNCSYCHNHNF